jgi:uncharacterized NAD(P)/FAD-binding protein YdhS
MNPTPVIAIVGAGFSGIAVAVQLLRQAERPVTVCLINRNHRFGRGMAYGTRSGSHLLNVPAGRMGLRPDDEGGFARFLVEQGLPGKPADFVPRKLYGDYLEAALESAQAQARPGVRLELRQADVIRLEEGADRDRLWLHDGSLLDADETILALGNFAPHPPGPDPAAWHGPAVVSDPWGAAALDRIPRDAGVLLAGSGLTAYDVVLGLLDRGHTGAITMMSRRGLLPQSHRQQETPPAAGVVPGDVLTGETRARAALRQVRSLIRHAETEGQDWRDVIGGLRVHTPRLWGQLDARARRQFLRHLLPYWDTHRHRAAPEIHQRIHGAIASGQVRVVAGRLESLEARGPGQVAVCWRPRNGAVVSQVRFDAVVNCTGPSSDLRRVPDGLIAQLRGENGLRVDPLGLGLEVDAAYRVLRAGGAAHPRLRYVGPLLRAQYWEATAVPELRMHALQLVRALREEGRL